MNDTSKLPSVHLAESVTTGLDPFLRRQAVLDATGLSKTTLYRAMQEGQFPKPYRLSEHTVGWRSSDIAKWMETRERVMS